ncbi:MAG: hypothetical protein IJX95_04300 [Lachnospiraceae bacterium]|nr:hypothetical protein [Lachnospiraceae bacterium]
MKGKRMIAAGILAAVLLGACNAEQPATDPVQTSGITQGIENEEQAASTPTATAAPEEAKSPEAASKPEVTVPPEETATPKPASTAAPKPTATAAPTATPKPTATVAPTATPVPTVSPKKAELAEHLRTAHKDEVSAEIVEKGYWYEVEKTCSDGSFAFDFKAVTGDLQNPMLVIDVTVEDDALTAAYDELKLYAYTLGERVYDNELDHYAACEGYGIRDEKTENLYHVTLPGSAAWMSVGEPFVVDICCVEFERKNAESLVYEIDVPEWRLTVSKHKLCPVLKKSYNGCAFTHNGREYCLNTVEFGQYGTQISFSIFVDSKEVSEYPGGAERFTANARPEWEDFLKQLTLEADGGIFRMYEHGFMQFGDYGNRSGYYEGGGTAFFPGIDYGDASDVKLWLETDGYDLKTSDKKMLHRKPQKPVMDENQKELIAHLRELHKDEISATIVEKGYYYAVDESRIADIFRFDLKAVTGDMQNPKMVFDVIVEDDMLTEMYENIHLYVGCFTEDQYNPENKYSWNRVGCGIRDKENKKLYHVTMDGAMLGYGPTVIDICRVGFDFDQDDSDGVLWYEVEPEAYLVDMPATEFHPAYDEYYDNMIFVYNGREYEIRYAEFGMYRTQIGFYTDIDAKEVPADEDGLQDYRDELQEEWLDFAKTLRFVADGKEYKVIDEDGKRGYVWFDAEEDEISYTANAYPYFPPIDFIKADVIEVKSGDTVHRLK